MKRIGEIVSCLPFGTPLYSPAYGVIYCYGVNKYGGIICSKYYCRHYAPNPNEDIVFSYDGKLADDGLIMLFPSKYKQNWEGLDNLCTWEKVDYKKLYYYVTSTGEIESKFNWNDRDDSLRYFNHNYFKTADEARKSEIYKLLHRTFL
jgi:hypothetical protein